MAKAIYQKVLDFDKAFGALQTNPVMLSEFNVHLAEERTRLNNVLLTQYDSSFLEYYPHCKCKYLKGEFRLGRICKICSSPVLHTTEREVKPALWIPLPENINGFVHPLLINWLIICLAKKQKLVQWMLDPSYKLGKVIGAMQPIVEYYPFKRGINGFIENFDAIMDYVFLNKHGQRQSIYETSSSTRDLFEAIKLNRGILFPRVLSVPSQLIMVTERSGGTRYVDAALIEMIDAVRTMGLSLSSKITQLYLKEAKVARALVQMALFHKKYINEWLGKKKGLGRKHMATGRLHFSARAVITSIAGIHDCRKLELPWGVGVKLLELHITARLLERNMTPIAIGALINGHVHTYHPLLDEIMSDIVGKQDIKLDDGHPLYKKVLTGLHAIFGRNPTMERGSAQYFEIGKIKTKVTDWSIGLPIPRVKAYNADFDRFVLAVAFYGNVDRKTILIAGIISVYR